MSSPGATPPAPTVGAGRSAARAPLPPRSRLWLWLNVGTLAASLAAWLTLQAALRRDCLRVQANFGSQGFCAGDSERPQAALDWSDGLRRQLLLTAIEEPRWLWPLASDADVTRGAAQLLLESARPGDAERVAAAVAADRLDPAFGALHFALASSQAATTHVSAEAVRALDGSPPEQLFGCIALSMLTGWRAERLERERYEPLPAADPLARRADLDSTAETLFDRSLADAVAEWKSELATLPHGLPTVRPRAELRDLLTTCPRRWGLF